VCTCFAEIKGVELMKVVWSSSWLLEMAGFAKDTTEQEEWVAKN
jgi:hypothetical protein